VTFARAFEEKLRFNAVANLISRGCARMGGLATPLSPGHDYHNGKD
jgi:hypothetical protein